MPPSKSTQRAKILRVLDRAPEGLTCKQIERMAGIRHATASAALTGLAAQGRVFRLDGFRKPYHWITPGNLRGRTIIGKPLYRKDLLIIDQQNQIEQLRFMLDYPTKSATVDAEQDRAEDEQDNGAHSRFDLEPHH
jgi:hypothetical protein